MYGDVYLCLHVYVMFIHVLFMSILSQDHERMWLISILKKLSVEHPFTFKNYPASTPEPILM